MICVCAVAASASAHDLERTQVSLIFARDGTFVLDVRNDPRWLTERLESIKGPFADRVVLWVDGHEIRPESVERIALAGGDGNLGGTFDRIELTTYRLRGRVPVDAKTLRWYYGLVGDPYPLTVRRADGRIVVEEVAGDAWSGTIDLSGQFAPTSMWPLVIVAVMIVAGMMSRVRDFTDRKRKIDRTLG